MRGGVGALFSMLSTAVPVSLNAVARGKRLLKDQHGLRLLFRPKRTETGINRSELR